MRLRIQPVDLGRQDEVAFGESLDLVSEDLNAGLSPGERQVGMVPLLLGHFTNAVDEVERLPEVREREAFLDVMFLDDLPAGQLIGELAELLPGERRGSTAAWHALFVGESAHLN